MAFLRVLKGSSPGQIVELLGERMVMGRHPDCHIVLDSAGASRHHCQILQSHSRSYIENLRSRNGVLVNGSQIDGRTELFDDDRIDICDIQFSFHDGPLPLRESMHEELGRLARSLKQHHLHYTGRWVIEVQEQLLAERSTGFQILAKGFFGWLYSMPTGGKTRRGNSTWMHFFATFVVEWPTRLDIRWTNPYFIQSKLHKA